MVKFIITLSILIVFGTLVVFLPYIKHIPTYAQTFDNAITFPDVNVTDSKNQNIPLEYEFLLVGNNTKSPLEVQNPDFSLNPPFLKMIQGQKYTINPANDEDIKYSTISVKLAPILFVAPDTKLQDADPEDSDQMTLGAATDVGNKDNSFITPSNLTSGNYILYAHLHYPNGITGVFSNLVEVASSSTYIKPKFVSNSLGFTQICNSIQKSLHFLCNQLINQNGSPNHLGLQTIKCTMDGEILSGIASLILPEGVVYDDLNALSGSKGCSNLINLAVLNSLPNVDVLLEKLAEFDTHLFDKP
ncbi:MAG TPA: hypothetical protein VN704_05020 [Verrucomicrobiae bacterium]|nr:hypothetical protein [Verrucomicrobiae bacterium]